MPPTTINAAGTVLVSQTGQNVTFTYTGGPTTVTTLTSAQWPVTFNNTNLSTQLNVIFTSNLTFTTDASQCFITGTNRITVDGSNNVVNINGVTNYQGLIRNGTGGPTSKTDITIKNIGVMSNTSTLAQDYGWVCQRYFGNNVINNIVENCYSNGDITQNAGGICGRDSGARVFNCYSIGAISGNYSGGIFGYSSQSGSSATDCYSTGDIGFSAGGIFGGSSLGTATNCYSTGDIGSSALSQAGGIFGSDSSNCTIASNCYSTGDINGIASGGIFGANSSGLASNCHSTGVIRRNSSGGIFGSSSTGTATNCYSIGKFFGNGCGGIFGSSSTGTATNCYSSGENSGDQTGGIFGNNSTCSATNCYSIGTIQGTSAGGICGYSTTGSVTNCYSTGAISGYYSGGILGYSSSCTAINCYSTGKIIGMNASGIGGTVDPSYCYYTDGSTNWLDTSADASLNVSQPNPWTDINLSSNTVPYLLSAFTNTLYSPSSATDASNSGISLLTDCSFSIVSVNDANPSLYPGITIDANNGDISFDLLVLTSGIYQVNVLATNTNDGYSFGTFTNTIPTTIDSSGTIFLRQYVSNIEYSNDIQGPWSVPYWPITLNNTDTLNTLEVKFLSDLSFNSADQYFIMGSNNITVDGSNNIANINIIGSGYPGLFQNGSYYYDASGNVDSSGNTYSNIIIQNIVLNSNGSSLLAIARTTNDGANSTKYCNGWICQGRFGLDGSNNRVNNCSSNGNTTTSYWVDSSGVQYNNNTGINNGGCILGDFCRAVVTNCESSGVIGLCAGGIFGRDGFGSATNCYSIGSIGQYAGGIFGQSSSSQAQATNCYSIGPIDSDAGGIFGQGSSGTATKCYSTGEIQMTASAGTGGIFGARSSSQAIATNCYSTGRIGDLGGGIFGGRSLGSATNCYSTGNFYGSGARGIFGQNSSGSATNCYSTGNGGNGIGGSDPSYCYPTGGLANWLDASANAALNVSGTVWTDIDLSSNTVPYLLSAFTSALYIPSTATDAATSGPSIVTDCSFSIVSINGLNPSLFPGITINANTGVISFVYSVTVDTVYVVNVLATNANDGYTFGTFTNTVAANLIAASGEVIMRQDGLLNQYSTDGGQTWIDVSWPLSLVNTGTVALGSRADPLSLTITFTDDFSFNSVDQYFVIDSSNIIIDGSSNVVYVNVPSYPGVFQNGIYNTDGYSYITVKNLGVESTYSTSLNGGWVGQANFGRNATDNIVTNCYSTGPISQNGGGILGSNISANVTVSNCYSTGDIGSRAGGIFGVQSSGSASNCYSIGPIAPSGGGIFGHQSSGSASNCYSIGPIGTNAGGIFGQGSQGSATNCYSTGDIGSRAGGIFGDDSRAGASATNCYSTGPMGNLAGGIFGYFSVIQGSATNCYSTGTLSNNSQGIGGADLSYCYYTAGYENWSDSAADASLNVTEPNVWTDIDENSEKVPYRLTSFYIEPPQSLYDPDSSNNAVTEYPSISNPTDYTWSITSVNGSTTETDGITINGSTGEIIFPTLSDDTYAVNVLAVDQFGNYSFETFTNIISNICFPAGTPIVTNQGIIAINKINPAIHTIRNKKIVAITKTVSPDKYLVKFEKDALGPNLPSEATTMTQNHKLFYKGNMIKAKELLKTHQDSVTKVPYNGQVLYNVLMEEHDKMVVNNLICETLHPENYVAKMHHAFKTLTPKQRVELVKQVNKMVITEDIYKKPTAKKFTFNVTK